MDAQVLYRGRIWTLLVLADGGRAYAREFVQAELSSGEQARLRNLLARVANYGLPSSDQLFKRLRGHKIKEQETAEEWFVELPESIADELMLDITEQISLRLHELGMTSAELAKRIGVSRRTIRRLLDGQASTSVSLLVSIAQVLGQRVAVQFYLAPMGEDVMLAEAGSRQAHAPPPRAQHKA
jgi:DNA-binding XRE family transcriptional regulator